MQSVVYVNKSPLASEDGKASSMENSSKGNGDDKLGLLTPKIEARVVDKMFWSEFTARRRKVC